MVCMSNAMENASLFDFTPGLAVEELCDEIDVANTATTLGRRKLALCLAEMEERGVFVANRPASLRRSMSKLMLSRLPNNVLPHTLVTRDLATVERFLADAPGDVVLKPLSGTRGQDVFRMDARRPINLQQIFDVLTRDGYLIAQHFVPEAVDGDIRMVLLDGRPLELDGRVAAVRRVPPGKDFRSNIAVGGAARRFANNHSLTCV